MKTYKKLTIIRKGIKVFMKKVRSSRYSYDKNENIINIEMDYKNGTLIQEAHNNKR